MTGDEGLTGRQKTDSMPLSLERVDSDLWSRPASREEEQLQTASERFWKRMEELIEARGGVGRITHTEREEMIFNLVKQLEPTRSSTLPRSGSSRDPNDVIKLIGDQIKIDMSKVLGLGSSGTKVFKGTFKDGSARQFDVAVKRVDRSFVSAISREAKALSLLPHRHVVQLFQLVDDEMVDREFAYLALELCTSSLERAVHDDDFHMEPVNLCRQLMDGVEHMHAGRQTNSGGVEANDLGSPTHRPNWDSATETSSHGIVHLDIHPGNVLLVEEAGPGSRMVAKLSDFGLSQAMITAESVGTRTHAGASGWAARELRLADSKANPKAADIFSLGCIFYFALTRGDHPFGDRHQREVNIAKGDAARDLNNRANGISVRWSHRHLIEVSSDHTVAFVGFILL